MSDRAVASSGSNATVEKKKSKGQQRRPMSKIENKTSLIVTFCKRRVGLFKKASELCVLCGVQIAIVLFSPANKAYTFGHPSVYSVMEHFLSDEDDFDKLNVNFNREGNGRMMIGRLCAELDEVKDRVKNGEKCSEMIVKVGNESKSWWSKSVDEMSLLELVEFKKDVKELAAAVDAAAAAGASTDPSLSLNLAL